MTAPGQDEDVDTLRSTVDELRSTADELRSTADELRRELWTARDALIGAQAESAALKVRNRHLEVTCGQLRDALEAQTRWARLVGRLTGNRYASTAIRRLRAVGTTQR